MRTPGLIPPAAFLLLALAVSLHGQISGEDRRYFDEFTKIKRDVNAVKEKHLFKFLPMTGISTQAARTIATWIVRNRPLSDFSGLSGLEGVTGEDVSRITNYFVAGSGPGYREDLTVDDLIENAAGGGEESADSSFRDDLTDLARRPADLNTASAADLARIPGLTPYNIYNILEYRKIRPFAKPEDLLKVRGIDDELLRRIGTFITANPPKLGEITRQVLDARRALKARPVQGEFSARLIGAYPLSTEQFSSYLYPSTAGIKESIRLSILDRAGLGAVWERDRGEKNINDMQKYYVEVKGFKVLSRLVAGNYRLRFGQGLTVAEASPASGGISSLGLSRPSEPVKPDLSASENAYYFGAAARLSWNGIEFVPFFSSRRYDATVEDRPTLGDGTDDTPSDPADNVVSSYDPQAEGLHATPSAIARRAAVKKTIWGGRIQYGLPPGDGFLRSLILGLSGYSAAWNIPLDPAMTDDNYFSFRGSRLGQLGFDWALSLQSLSLYGEISASFQPEIRNFFSASNAVGRHGIGLLAGLNFSVRDWTTDLSFRRYDREFFGFEHAAPAASSSPNGETGFHAIQTVRFDRTFRIEAYVDLFHKDWRAYSEALPSFGWESSCLAEKKLADKLVLSGQVKGDSKEMRVTVDGVGRNSWVDKDWRVRLEARWSPRSAIAFRSRFETARTVIRGLDRSLDSSLFFGDISWTPSPALKIWLRSIVFDCDFDAGIWEFENEVPSYMSSLGFSGQGNRLYIHTQTAVIPGKLFLYLKLGATWYFRADSINVILSETETPTRSELDAAQSVLGARRYDIHCQLVYEF